jgi:hypothetical protein
MSAETSGQHRPMPNTPPWPARWAIVGGTSAGVIGAIVGLIVGLAYPPTAWFAVFELGVPATIAGGLVGFFAALIVMAGRRITRLIVRGIRT